MKYVYFVFLMQYVFFISNVSGQDKPEKFKVTVRDVDKIKMVYYEFTGPYDQSFSEFAQLISFAKENKLTMDKFSLGIFKDDPELTPADKLRSEIGLAITSKAKVDLAKYKYKELPAGKAVTVKYKGMDEIMPAYEAIAEYIKTNNIKTENYSVELYFGQDPDQMVSEILFYITD
jgi:DNA gyrase inhibitor GyrI